jgi:hypothetical protein
MLVVSRSSIVDETRAILHAISEHKQEVELRMAIKEQQIAARMQMARAFPAEKSKLLVRLNCCTHDGSEAGWVAVSGDEGM